MTDLEPKPDPTDDPALPPALVAALRQAHAGPAARAGFDAQVLAAAQAELAAAHAARRRRMKIALWLGGPLAAAAAVALAVLLAVPGERARTGDIRDAFALARALRDGASTAAADDLNRDGKVDGDDVRLLAAQAVALAPAGARMSSSAMLDAKPAQIVVAWKEGAR